ncbi:MAG: histidine phosphatase family protein [Gammaproteobacteria bacterium]|nr:histidine phosphatase family protein [Gammaproteobacteria bacterium]
MKEYRQHKFELPEGATDILLVRHGESRPASPDDPFPLVDGHGDPELAPQGREQAVAVGERLKSLPINAVYVTNLRRTAETAEPLCRHLAIEHRVEPDLREVHLGDWEGGVFRIKVHENDPIIQEMHQEQRWDVIPGAESTESLRERVSRGLRNIASNHPNELVVAVAHGGVIGHIIANATGATPFAFNGCDNGSISRIVMVDGEIVVRGFNDVSHLGGAGSMTSMMT